MGQDSIKIPETSTSRTAKIIAYSLISIYGLLLFAIGIIAALKSGEEGKHWMELLKSGFLILGGGLTTIIGYYFGSRGVQEAQDSAEKSRQELRKQKLDFEEFKKQFAPTEDEDSLGEPEDPIILEDE